MTTKISSKVNASSMQVIKTLQVLLEDNYTMQELVQKLNENEEDAIFNNSVISKYINTCRYCGFEIPKIHNKYFVASMPFGLNLTNTDLNLIEILQNTAKINMSNSFYKNFIKLIEKLNRYSNKRIIKFDKSSTQLPIEIFMNAVAEKRKIKIFFKNHLELVCIPIRILENNNKTFFYVYHNEKEKIIDSDRISGLTITNEKFIHKHNDQVVIYKLTGKLAKRYSLRENESLIESSENSIIISNRGENKEILFARLLRYGANCEITNPKIYRDEMKQIIKNTLKNYGEV